MRGWLRRFAAHAEAVRVWFTVLAHDMDPLLGRIFPTGSLFGDAVEAVGMAARAAEKRLGPQHGWGFGSRASAGALLANTGCPWAGTLCLPILHRLFPEFRMVLWVMPAGILACFVTR